MVINGRKREIKEEYSTISDEQLDEMIKNICEGDYENNLIPSNSRELKYE